MRSRFSAFALENFEYLIASWHSTTRPPEILKEDPPLQWIYLKIIKTEVENERGESFVTFEARYRENGKAGKFIEKSRFIKEDGLLKYLDGEFLDAPSA
ncbi:MAG TPA: zinc chelation protein SecC [Candidatus Ignatzschineria merdigallinarum]|uniref:Zinc chelation protein SecC n=1 Tax=Candidatus Ignatzschineria merdigallinarum TaxID=2838621 RepID=A0A9D1Q4A7_9GAMM|nr:zinc chelation protein SecC [Candidatus Ignatzschineria merdigallinarum]